MIFRSNLPEIYNRQIEIDTCIIVIYKVDNLSNTNIVSNSKFCGDFYIPLSYWHMINHILCPTVVCTLFVHQSRYIKSLASVMVLDMYPTLDWTWIMDTWVSYLTWMSKRQAF
jgi:hypothetical protein